MRDLAVQGAGGCVLLEASVTGPPRSDASRTRQGCTPFSARVTAGEGWLASRGLLREQRVRTDVLVSVRRLDGISQRLRLRDAFGGRVEINPEVLVNNPDLWHRLDEDAHKSDVCGSLTCGATALRQISERIDRETALNVFKVSDLD
jgi:hypothetical protein